MIAVFILGLLGGLDNLQVGSAIGMMGVEKKRIWMAVGPFVFFDVAMTLLGLLTGRKLSNILQNISEWLGPAIIIVIGLYMLIREIMEKEKQHFINNKWLLVLLPFLFSLDNLFAGLGLGTAGYPVAPTFAIIAICSRAMALLGLMLGQKVRSLIPAKLEMITGLYLVGLGIFLVITK
jgi:putative Mn2+ efflux pump MntP